MAAPKIDPAILAHLEWIGFVRPTGLVVSAPALLPLALWASVCAGCFSPFFADDQIACGEAGCPPGLRCGADGLCRRAEDPVGAPGCAVTETSGAPAAVAVAGASTAIVAAPSAVTAALFANMVMGTSSPCFPVHVGGRTAIRGLPERPT